MHIWNAHKKPIDVVAFSPDGSMLASAGRDNAVKMWDVPAGKERWGIRHGKPGWIQAMAFSPNGRWLAAGEKGGVQIRDPSTGEEIEFLARPGWLGRCNAIAFTPDSARLVMDGSEYNRRECLLQWWKTGRWTELRRWEDETGTGYLRLAFAPDGRTLATMTFGTVAIRDVARKRVLWSCPVWVSHYTTAMALSPDGQIIVFAAGKEMTVYDIKATKEVARLTASAKHFQGAAFSPHGRYITTVSNDETAITWDTRTWTLHHAHAWGVGKLKCVTFSPDGCLGAAGSDRGKIVIWDVG